MSDQSLDFVLVFERAGGYLDRFNVNRSGRRQTVKVSLFNFERLAAIGALALGSIQSRKFIATDGTLVGNKVALQPPAKAQEGKDWCDED